VTRSAGNQALARLEVKEFASRILKALRAFDKPLRGLWEIHASRELNSRKREFCAPLRFAAWRGVRCAPALPAPPGWLR
ncbi:hypothetical protein, partial [Streptomyces anulatus]|uniref:hypothetical protein n=2 Tax=Streptomyces TaxID=1883 RepID=UPI00343A97A7